MNLCKCDACGLIEEIEASSPVTYDRPTVPRGWSTVTIARRRAMQPLEPSTSTMSIDAGPLGEMDITTEAPPARDPIVIPVVTELHVCPKCLDKVAGHPNISKRIASDDTRAEAASAAVGLMPSMSIKARRRDP